jgi:NTP pyrophosphatase (non-canonical NTP hydrolase)
MDSTTRVSELKGLIEDFVQERDWSQFHKPKDMSMAIAVEASELLELFLWEPMRPPEEIRNDPKKMKRIREELADVIILSISLANRLDMDLSDAIREKIKVNAEKYPPHKSKGSCKKYTEL